MKILTGNQIKEADKYTIEKEPISSINLMERASQVIAQWFCKNTAKETPLLFLIGKGNNGGDGLAVARMLANTGYKCAVYLLCENENDLTEDCRYNLGRLPFNVETAADLENIGHNTVIVDALLGSGVRGALKRPLPAIIDTINDLPNLIISIDLPSGMITEYGNAGQKIIRADVTLTLQFPKLAMLLPEAGEYCGKIEVLPIGLREEYMHNAESKFYYTTEEYINGIVLKRDKFTHKGSNGHALLICGSRGMAGAAVLATGAALRSGCGLVTLHLPHTERFSVQTTYPSAMLSLDDNDAYFSGLPSGLSKYTAIGIGCGLGQEAATLQATLNLFNIITSPIVIDADALNMIATHSELKLKIPAGSILTPHPGELKRLVGEWNDDEDKIARVRTLAHETKSVIVVKGAHTMVCLPGGDCFFNPTGNSGMAKGGSGDVLTGYITGLLARGYTPAHAAILGVYVHGMAGDKAAQRFGKEAILSKDLIDRLQY